MTTRTAQRFAQEWIERFNARDLPTLLAEFSEDCTFISPRAQARGENGVVHSRKALAEYWGASLQSIQSLHFVLDRVLYDPSARSMAIVYQAAIDGRSNRAVEIYEFDEHDRIVRGEAMYGAGL